MVLFEKPSPTSFSCHRHISSPTSVTNIDVTHWSWVSKGSYKQMVGSIRTLRLIADNLSDIEDGRCLTWSLKIFLRVRTVRWIPESHNEKIRKVIWAFGQNFGSKSPSHIKFSGHLVIMNREQAPQPPFTVTSRFYNSKIVFVMSVHVWFSRCKSRWICSRWSFGFSMVIW